MPKSRTEGVALAPGCCRHRRKLHMWAALVPPRRGFLVRNCAGCGRLAAFIHTVGTKPSWLGTFGSRVAATAACRRHLDSLDLLT